MYTLLCQIRPRQLERRHPRPPPRVSDGLPKVLILSRCFFAVASITKRPPSVPPPPPPPPPPPRNHFAGQSSDPNCGFMNLARKRKDSPESIKNRHSLDKEGAAFFPGKKPRALNSPSPVGPSRFNHGLKSGFRFTSHGQGPSLGDECWRRVRRGARRTSLKAGIRAVSVGCDSESDGTPTAHNDAAGILRPRRNLLKFRLRANCWSTALHPRLRHVRPVVVLARAKKRGE